jgi:hypothetical protein
MQQKYGRYPIHESLCADESDWSAALRSLSGGDALQNTPSCLGILWIVIWVFARFRVSEEL